MFIIQHDDVLNSASERVPSVRIRGPSIDVGVVLTVFPVVILSVLVLIVAPVKQKVNPACGNMRVPSLC